MTVVEKSLRNMFERGYKHGYEDALKKNKGAWITDETSGSALNDRYYCSNCGKELKMPYTVIKAEQKNGKYLFCDRCGADMRGE